MKKTKTKKTDRFYWRLGDIKILGVCHLCKNKFNYKPGCEAFPDEIPMEFLLGQEKHTKRHTKQNNDILFESIKE